MHPVFQLAIGETIPFSQFDYQTDKAVLVVPIVPAPPHDPIQARRDLKTGEWTFTGEFPCVTLERTSEGWKRTR